jgi:hypothetical protein
MRVTTQGLDRHIVATPVLQERPVPFPVAVRARFLELTQKCHLKFRQPFPGRGVLPS